MWVKKSLFILIILCLTLTYLYSEEGEYSIAFLDLENMNRNPGFDYLKGMIEGLILYDLSTSDGVALVNRSDLDKVIYEQKLKLSGIVDDRDMSMTVGRLVGADYLLTGSYVYLGEDLIINMKLINSQTGESTAFSSRGYTENTVHRLSEEIMFALTGTVVPFQSPESKRSIISMRDETPGSVSLFSYLIDAEIFFDEEFIGYTKGDGRNPFKIEDVSPGIHTVRTHLGKNFGVIDLPEFKFHDWEAEFEVKPGKSVVLRDETRHFNDLIYDHLYLIWEGFRIEKDNDEPAQRIHDKTFTDREGNEIPVSLDILSVMAEGKRKFDVSFTYSGKKHDFSLETVSEGDAVLDEKIGKVRLKVTVDSRYPDRFDIDYSVKRTDIWQNMQNE